MKEKLRESTTLKIIFPAALILILKFLVAGFSFGPLGQAPTMGATEFGGGLAAVMLIWLGREWTEKVAKNDKITKQD